ncbi:MAG: AmmeMemoRadiSam system protein B [Candidatus Hydrogenedentota bacterium]
MKNYVVLFLSLFFMSLIACGSDTTPQTTKIRYPAVSGLWYPSDKQQLESLVAKLLNQNKVDVKIEGKIIGLISPHAGFSYSGGVAACGYNLLKNKKYKTVVGVGLSHRYPLNDVSILEEDIYRTPLGDVLIDKDWVKKIKTKLPSLKYVKDAHIKEHSIEAQVPFLQAVLSDFKLVEVLVNRITDENMKTINTIFEEAYKDNCLIIVSTDLSHYHPYVTACEKDSETIKFVLNKDFNGLIESMQKGYTEACGSAALVGITMFINKFKLKPTLVEYKNSGDVTGDFDRGVVGYASIVLIDETKKEETAIPSELEEINYLTEEEERILLGIARETLRQWVLEDKKYNPPLPSEEKLKSDGACFVTLTRDGQLRGCIGHIIGREPLYLSVRDNAIAASSEDYRFPPVSKSEYDNIHIEISVMTPLQKVSSIDEIKVGRDGLVLRKGRNQGVFLPQVPVDWKWDLYTYLDQLCRKAGLPAGEWKSKDTEIYKFQAQVFEEDH